MPYNNDLTPYPINAEGPGKVIYFNIETNALIGPGCENIQAFGINVLQPHQTQIYAYAEWMGFQGSDNNMLILSVSNTQANIRKIGSDNHHIQVVLFPSRLSCYGGGSSLVTSGPYGQYEYIMTGKDAYAAFTSNDTLSNSRPYNSFYGATCTSLNTTNPCTLSGVTAHQKYVGKLIYMTTSTSKFVYSSTPFEDGVGTYPSIGQGTITQTNGGGKSIIIVSNARDPVLGPI